VAAFSPAWLLARAGASMMVLLAASAMAPLVFVRLARLSRVLDAGERERVRAALSRRGMGPVLAWLVP
jgi:hypothetical protein